MKARTVLGIGAGIALATTAVVLGVQLFRGNPSAPPAATAANRPAPTSTATPPPTTLAESFTKAGAEAAFRRIQARRQDAFIKVDPNILLELYTKECKCLSGDREQIQSERRLRWHSRKHAIRVVTVKALDLNGSQQLALVEATMHSDPIQYVDQQEIVRYTEPAKDWKAEASLLWDGRIWRMAAIHSVS